MPDETINPPLQGLPSGYRGRLAPSPTGYLHLGHARTFEVAQVRARAANGTLILRNDDLDRDRCRPDFAAAMLEDLRWWGLDWDEGPDLGGPFAPYRQSQRLEHYCAAFETLRAGGFLFPCTCSRREIQQALSAPHGGEEEPIYPGTCRNAAAEGPRAGRNWRFRLPAQEVVTFQDGACGEQRAVTNVDFGDFLVWRKDDLPSYQLATVADDAAMQITEVVRGCDLITSTFRQLLLYRALDFTAPGFFHAPLVLDEHGQRLAKRHDALALRALRHSRDLRGKK